MLPTKKTAPKQDLSDLSLLEYGLPKSGKSTWASGAEGALFLATEPGLNALDVYQVPIQSWEDLRKACAEIVAGNHPFKTVILDTIDNAYKFCTDYILKKFKIEHESDLGYGKGYVYDHATEEGFSGQNYFPDGVPRRDFYRPGERGFEREIKKRLDYWEKLRQRGPASPE